MDTHKDTHVAAAIDQLERLLGTAEFPTTPAGYRALLTWLAGFGTVERIGVEGTGAWGAGLARFLRTAGVHVIEGGGSGHGSALWRTSASERSGTSSSPRSAARTRPPAGMRNAAERP